MRLVLLFTLLYMIGPSVYIAVWDRAFCLHCCMRSGLLFTLLYEIGPSVYIAVWDWAFSFTVLCCCMRLGLQLHSVIWDWAFCLHCCIALWDWAFCFTLLYETGPSVSQSCIAVWDWAFSFTVLYYCMPFSQWQNSIQMKAVLPLIESHTVIKSFYSDKGLEPHFFCTSLKRHPLYLIKQCNIENENKLIAQSGSVAWFFNDPVVSGCSSSVEIDGWQITSLLTGRLRGTSSSHPHFTRSWMKGDSHRWLCARKP